VASVTTLKLSAPETVDLAELEQEVVTAVADRLRDEHGYEIRDAAAASGPNAGREYRLDRDGAIVVHRDRDALTVKLRGVSVDARDLFTGVSSELEQRHEGLRVEID
jgi:hypothetical protein